MPCAFRHLISLLVLITLAQPLVQAQTTPLFTSYQAFKDSLTALTEITDETTRNQALTVLWDTLQAHQQIPFTHGTSVAFLYRGTGNTIHIAGDFNGWNPAQGAATRMAATNVWIREEVFPEDARLDYKIVRNGNQWILDPANTLTQRGGFGDNSELRMPAYVPSPWVETDPTVPRGIYTSARPLASTTLGYTVTYRVYTPAGYDAEQLRDLPVIYVTDGHEYADDRTGSMRIVLDNMIAAKRIPPVIAVFIDPRVSGTNLRASQYIENPQFAAFVAQELVPAIDQTYRTDARRYARAILGTSLGGLNSAYFATQHPETFYLIGIQSPAFAVSPTIYDRYRDAPVRDVRIHMSWGTINDVGNAGDLMAAIFTDKGYSFETVVLNEGHSWGSWRALLDDVLEYFWGSTSNVAAEENSLPTSLNLHTPYPNPFHTSTTIAFTLSQPTPVRLTIHDALGRKVAVLADDIRRSGNHRITWIPDNLPSGVYYSRLEVEHHPVQARSLILIK